MPAVKGDGKVSTPELAAIFGVSREAISEARRRGQLTEGRSFTKRGRLYRWDVVEARKEWNSNVTGHGNGRTIGEAGQEKPNGTSIAAIKKAQAVVDLEKKKIELDRLKGTLVEKDSVYKELFEFGQKVRQRMQAIPARIVDDVLAAASRTEALRIIADAIDDGLTDLADADNLKI